MNIKKYILSFFILLSTMVFGQDMIADSLEINRIDHLVNEIKNDSSLKTINLDDVKLLNRFNKKTYHPVTVQLKNDKIVQIYLTDKSQFSNASSLEERLMSFTKYVIENDDLIYGEENYLYSKNKLYYKDTTLIKSLSYVDEIDDKNIKRIYKNFKKINKVSKRKIKKLQNEEL